MMRIFVKSSTDLQPGMFIIALLLIFLTSAVHGCTEKSYLCIVQDAVRLMPENFQWLVDKHEAELLRGVKSSCDQYSCRADLIREILQASQNNISTIRNDHSYKSAVYTFGVIAKLAATLNHPLTFQNGLADSNWKTDYDIYLEKRRSKFRIRWRGTESLPRSESDLSKLLSKTKAKNVRISKLLVKTLNEKNHPIHQYDERSIPFGVGSIAYSNAVANIAYVWLHNWYQSGGVNVDAGGK